MKNLIGLLMVIMSTSPALASALKCGDKFESVTVKYDLGTEQTVVMDRHVFSRGPLYTSASPGETEGNERVYYVVGGEDSHSYVQFASATVADIPDGIVVTLNNPSKSKITFVKKDGRLTIASENKELLGSVAGQDTAFDCSNE